MAGKKKHIPKARKPASPVAQSQEKLLPPPLPPREDGAKRKVLCIGFHSMGANRIHAYFRNGWEIVRMDSDAGQTPDIVGSLNELAHVPSGSFDAIWCPHVLEHFYVHQIGAGLREMFRILNNEGLVFMTLADIELAAAYIANGKAEEEVYSSPAGPICALDIIYGYHKFISRSLFHASHKFGFTAETIGLALRSCGFTNIRVQRQNAEITAVAHKYNYDHPNRVERVVMIKGAQEQTPPNPPTLPQKTEKPADTPVSNVSNRTIDDLNQPPRVWIPLNLGLKK